MSAWTGCQPTAPNTPPFTSGRIPLLSSSFPETRAQTTGELTQFLEKIASFSVMTETE